MAGKSQARLGLTFASPTLILFLVLLTLPILYSIYLSFFDTNIESLTQGGANFIGLQNYVRLFTDQSFLSSVWVITKFLFFTTVAEVLLALVVAIYLDQVLKVPKIIETLLIVPMFVIPVVSGLTFRYIFDPGDGPIGTIYGWFDAVAPGFLGDPTMAFFAVVLQDIWRMWPFVFLVIYAGIKSLPKEPIEAIKLDGANLFQTCRYLIIPLSKNTLAIAVMMKVIESLKAFTEIYVMTGGGPGDATNILSMYIVNQAFSYFQLGYASAASTVLLFVGTIVALTFLWMNKKANSTN